MLGQVKSKRNYGKEIYKARETRTRYMCDLCDKKTSIEFIQRTIEHVYLCPDCHKHISAMPEGKIKDSIIRFLVRNVI